FFPAPTVDKNITRDYNLESQISTGKPRREDLIRVDYNITSNMRVFTHYINNKNSTTTPYGSFVLGSNLPLIPITDARPGKSFAAGFTTLLSPVMTNEFTFGYGKNDILIAPTAGASVLSKQTTGIDLPVLYPSAVQDNYIPSFGYGGTKINNSNSYGTGRAPFVNFNNTIDIIDNFSRVQGSHLLKFGIYMQHSRKNQSPDGDPNGFYDFGDSPANPFDTGYGFSNAALGIYQTFRQNNKYATGEYRYWNVEWYAQDTWKVARRLTLDYGLRMALIQPQYDQSLQTASWLRERYDPAQAVRLYYPVYSASGALTGAIDRRTGQTLPSFAVGRIVPNSGNILNGIVQAGKDIEKGLIKNRGIHWGPRVGIAWDVLGDQTFVIRTGGGIYFDRYQGNRVFSMLNNPPTALPAQLTFGYASQIDPATALIGPPSLNAFDYNGQVPTVFSYNFGIQKRLPGDFVLDVAYVGSQSRHLQNQINLNAIPYGAFFRPENAGLNDANFYRPYPGFGDIRLFKADANANYNSLQVSANRRLARDLFFDLSYTWSRALTTASGDGDFARIDDKNRQGFYGLADFHRKHNLAVNFIYEIPTPLKGNRIAKAAFGAWQLSGIYQFLSGQPDSIGFGITGVNNQILTGSFTEGARVRLVGDPTKGVAGGPYFNINPDAFRIPVVGSVGLDAPNRYFLRPGVNNWNMSLQKTISIVERARLQFRFDAFNVFNHTQFSDYNRTLNYSGLNNPTPTNLPRFNEATGRWDNPVGFGAVNAVRDPRTVQLVMRIQF
ncbi:MAG: hypothetical protein H7039_12645, partial [Bryobacteraceae bacterium]|nr:hypothetical protein [Bryobacteraceae bacterium]